MSTLRRLISFLRPFSGQVFLSILLSFGTVASGVGLLGTSAFLIASAALRPSIAELQVAIVGVRFFGIVRGLLRYLERLVSHDVNLRLLAGLRVWLYRAIEPLAPAGLEMEQGGDLLHRMVGELETLENFFVRVVSPVLNAGLVTLGISWFCGRMAPVLGWVAAMGMFLTGVLVPAVQIRLSRNAGRRWIESRSQLNAFTTQVVQGMNDWIMFGRVEKAQAHFHRMNRTLSQTQVHMAKVQALGGSAGLWGSGLTVWFLLLLGGQLVLRGEISGVDLAVLSLMVMASFEAVTPLHQAAAQFEATLQAGRRIFEWVDRPNEAPDPKGAVPSLSSPIHVRFEGVTLIYPGRTEPALQDFWMDLPSGKRVALVGESGAGKSTVGQVLMRFRLPYSGQVRVNGWNLRDLRGEDLRTHLAVVSQQTYLFSGTLRENLLLAVPQASEEELLKVLERVQLQPLLRRLPKGLDTWLGAQGEMLSGGERQRIALARALLKPASFWLLDEPVSGLDAETARTILRMLWGLAGSRSVLYITHFLAELEEFDEILVLQRGRVIERGKHADLLQAGGWYAQAWQLQRSLLDEGELLR
ncbi:thiol reductant ABC exporter subunit CydC [Anaerolinea thermophila]|uniref:Transport ATP-binding protein CydC n=1 Tax=Anaerolinea thermophila (strain DSM 14523 / JCM 11388 / NBRC 100420 / UNI-1) TaxID=926569 RepID=E8N3U3_ANATU|nr:thiol reductant ABC exporter subunit CydC [Anaerolinea thermophila]BAJ63107.1 transport ATP-binding protein CydC [Anaerolinea thermophila UNI-1]